MTRSAILPSAFPVCRRVWRPAGAVLVVMPALTCWFSASATVIKVNTLKETAIFDPPGPIYEGNIVGDSGTPGECSLREPIDAANTHIDVFGCPAGTGNDTIELMPGSEG